LDTNSIGRVLWTVCINDTFLALGVLAIKSILLSYLGVIRTSMFIKFRQIYYIIEGLVHLYRLILPVPLWISYFSDNSTAPTIFISLYIYFKIPSLWNKLKQLASLMKACFFWKKIWSLCYC